MNRCEEFVKSRPEEEQKMFREAVATILNTVTQIDGWQDIDIIDLIDSVTSSNEKEECKNSRSHTR